MGRYGAYRGFKKGEERWDSKNEYRRWIWLSDLQKKGTITDLEKKVKYEFVHNGVKIAKFSPDFRYKVNGHTVVEDFKGQGKPIPRDFKLRCKMLKAFYGIDCHVVTDPTDITLVSSFM